jgi:hypothetical protein
MGIKSFSKVFTPKIIKFKDIEKKKISVDAYLVLYQSALGSSSVNLLTDPDGNPTMHINVILGKCLNFIKNKNKCCWVFDYHEKDYSSPEKIHELTIRKKKRESAEKKLKSLEQTKKEIEKRKKYNELFSSDDDSDDEIDSIKLKNKLCKKYSDTDKDQKKTDDIQSQINQKEKEIFSINDILINDCKFILESFNVMYTTAPKGIEAESICAQLTNHGYDITWSCDTDALLYNSKVLVREIKSKGKKVLQQYTLDDLLTDAKINIKNLQKIGMILGSDHAPKTPGVGPGTVLKKYKDIELTEEQTNAVNVFSKVVDISLLKYNGYIDDITPKDKLEKINKLIEWLVVKKGFNRDKLTSRIEKVIKYDV